MDILHPFSAEAKGRIFDIEIDENTFTVSESGKEVTKALGEEVIFNLN